jgi:hypothetical protein
MDVEEMPPGVPHGVERNDMPAHEHTFVVAIVAHRVGDRVQVVAGVAHLVDQAVVDRVMIAANMQSGSRAVPHAAVQKAVVVPAHEDAGLARADRVATALDLPDPVLPHIMRQVREMTAVERAMVRILQNR